MKSAYEFSPSDETRGLEAAVRGDLDAFNQLVLRYQNLAYPHAFRLMGDAATAEDAVQESFLKAYRNLHRFRGGSFRAWLMRIITNTVYDMLRASQRHPLQTLFPTNEHGEEIESPAWLADPRASVQATVERNELARTIHSSLNQLPARYREVLTLVDLYAFDYMEAAQALNIPVGTVKSRLARARVQLRGELERRETIAHVLNRGETVPAFC
jgi:RNA polymerase sigma-70 factor (ECF subfamily)